jgi:hypothetical protein
VATLHFSGTDVKVFTPISSALANLPNGAGTIVVLVRQTTAAGDMAGLLDSTGSTWYHALGVHNAGNGNKLWDDDNTTILGITSQNTSLTDWKLFALDWGAVAGVESFHFRDQTTLGSWTHENSSVNNSVVAGPGTSGWFRIGYFLDIPIGAMDMAVVAVWAGTRFASGDYGSWTKTSDLYNHAKGRADVPVRADRDEPYGPDRRVDVFERQQLRYPRSPARTRTTGPSTGSAPRRSLRPPRWTRRFSGRTTSARAISALTRSWTIRGSRPARP